jgi:hypothetical protein
MTKTIAGLLALGVLTFAATAPASAASMKCNAADTAKVTGMVPMMTDGANKSTAYKEMTATNMAMSKGDMRGCTMHLNMAAKAAMSK